MARSWIVMFGMLAVLAAESAGQSSLYRREVVIAYSATTAPSGDDALPKVPPVSLIALPLAKPQVFAKHDLVTVIVREMASASSNGQTKTSRESTIDGKVSAWVTLADSDQFIRASKMSGGQPAVNADLTRDFDGKGNATRTDSLIARIQAEIIDIKPNGNLVIQASKKVQTDEEVYTITVTGVCRTKDILPDNTVLSTQVSELNVVKTATEGAVKDATKRGKLHKMLDWFNLF